MIMPMRAGRSGKRRLKKRGKVLQMLFVVVNTCMFKQDSCIHSYRPRSLLRVIIVLLTLLIIEHLEAAQKLN
jgi:hypothetical protein